MQFLKALVIGVALTAGSITVACAPPSATAQAYTQLNGVWQGMYWGEGNQPTGFQATLQHGANGALTGSTVETNNFSAEQIPFLLATIRGNVRGNSVTFVKTYDGTGGQTHSINYTGQIMQNGRRIVGQWQVEGSTQSGRFEMAR